MTTLKQRRERLEGYDFSPHEGEDWPQYMGRARKHRDDAIALIREQHRLLEGAREALKFWRDEYMDAPGDSTLDEGPLGHCVDLGAKTLKQLEEV